MGVVVVGSANSDVLIAVDEFPRAGETLASRGVRRSFGARD